MKRWKSDFVFKSTSFIGFYKCEINEFTKSKLNSNSDLQHQKCGSQRIVFRSAALQVLRPNIDNSIFARHFCVLRLRKTPWSHGVVRSS